MRRIALLLLAAGIGIASWLDRPVDETLPEVGGFKVLQADFHVHSFLGDGVLSPFNLVLEARRRGLQAFALTNHNQLFAARLARRFAELIDGPIVLVGQEITSPDYHFAAAGLKRPVSWRLPAAEAIDDVHRQGGVVIAAHPVRDFWPALDPVVARLDGAEVMHPLVYVEERAKREIRDFFTRARRANPQLSAIGSSDFHGLQSFGICRTLVFVESLDEAGVLQAIRTGRTVVYDEEGRPYGDQRLIGMLGGRNPAPAPARRAEISWAGALAWSGLLGWLVFGSRSGTEVE